MKCSQCSKPASLHITEIRKGDVQELHLCQTCANDYLHSSEVDEVTGDAETLAAKIAEVTSDDDLEELDRLICPNCGISFREFRGQGRLGCPHDYIAFENELMPLLENIHGESQHAGKFPKRAPDASQRQYELIKLRNELKTAVDDEEYESAARLRDEIQSLVTKLGLSEFDDDDA